jgi:aspartate 1-decarboxylase
MLRRFLNAKLHRATVTETELDYVGSLTLDPELMELADIRVDEQVDVYNITRGTRFTTYAIQGERGRREVCVNGAAAHLAQVGDRVIVATYVELEPEELDAHRSTVIVLGENNEIEGVNPEPS